jgi:hypothetical protein
MTALPNKRQPQPAVTTQIVDVAAPIGARLGHRHARLWHVAAFLRRRRGVCDLLAAALFVTLVAAPMLFTDSGFAVDFTNQLWLVWAAGHALGQAGHPTYFLSATGLGVFYPWFAFYGGSLYMIVGGISQLLGGDPVLAYVGVSTLAIAGSYLGMVWLGREFGLRGWASHAPALVVVTSAYYITNLYGRGAWTEFMATAAIAPLLASGVHLVRATTWRAGPVLVFVISVVIFTGSHNITLLWGSTVAVVAALVMWLAMGRPMELPIRRLVMVAGLGFAAVLVNAWYLIPDIGYAQSVQAHTQTVTLTEYTYFDTPGVLLDPLRTVPAASSTPALYVQAPVWFLAWGVLAGTLLLWRRGSWAPLRRAWVGALIVVALLLGVIMVTPLWGVMPFPFSEIQFPYRLGSYVYYAVGALVLAGALALQRAAAGAKPGRTARALRVGLVGVCAVSVALCVWQQWVPSTLFSWSYKNRDEALANVDHVPLTWYDHASYNDDSAPLVSVQVGRLLKFSPSQVHGDRLSLWVDAPPGLAPIQTDIAGGQYLVHLSGLRWIGRDRYGFAVVQREREGSGPVHVVVQTTLSTAIIAGRALSALGLLAILAVLVIACARSFRARRSRRLVGQLDPPVK